ncbi:MAG: hypothetical protein LBB25_02470, partial [Holosporaceae bacterium]|nr:hypothetical protein [Holosporaceae bacterium]
MRKIAIISSAACFCIFTQGNTSSNATLGKICNLEKKSWAGENSGWYEYDQRYNPVVEGKPYDIIYDLWKKSWADRSCSACSNNPFARVTSGWCEDPFAGMVKKCGHEDNPFAGFINRWRIHGKKCNPVKYKSPDITDLDLYEGNNLILLLKKALISGHEVINPLVSSPEYSKLLKSLEECEECSSCGERRCGECRSSDECRGCGEYKLGGGSCQANFTDEKYLQRFLNAKNALQGLINFIKTNSLQNVDLKFFEAANDLLILPLIRHETENVFLEARRRIEDNIQDLYGSSTHKGVLNFSVGFPFGVNCSISLERHKECFTNLRCFFTDIDAYKGNIKGSCGVFNNMADVGLKLALAKAKVTLFYSLESYLDFLNQRCRPLHLAMLKTQNTSLRNTDYYRSELQELEKENLLNSIYFESRLHIFGALPWNTYLKSIDVTKAKSTENIDEITGTIAAEASAGLKIGDNINIISLDGGVRISKSLKKYKKKIPILSLLGDDMSFKEGSVIIKDDFKAFIKKDNDKFKHDFLSLPSEHSSTADKIINILHMFCRQLQESAFTNRNIIAKKYIEKQIEKRLEEAQKNEKQIKKCLEEILSAEKQTLKSFKNIIKRVSDIQQKAQNFPLRNQELENFDEYPTAVSTEQEQIEERKKTEIERWQKAKNEVEELKKQLKLLQESGKDDEEKSWSTFFCQDMDIESLKSACMMGYFFRENLLEKISDEDRRAEALQLLKRIRKYLERLEALYLLNDASDKEDISIPKTATASILETEITGDVKIKNQSIGFSCNYRVVKHSPISTENGRYIIVRVSLPTAISGQICRRVLETHRFKSMLSYLDKNEGEREPTDQEGSSAKLKDYSRVIATDVGNIISSLISEIFGGGSAFIGMGAMSDHEWIFKITQKPETESISALPFVGELIPYKRKVVIDYMLSTGKSVAKANFTTPTLLPIPSLGISTSNASGKVEKRTGSDTLHDMFAKYNSMSLGAIDTNTPITSINLLFANQSHQLLKIFRSIGEKNINSNVLFELQEVYNGLLRLHNGNEREINESFEVFIKKCMEIAPMVDKYENGTEEERCQSALEIGIKNNQGRLAKLCRLLIDICEKQYIHIFKPHYDNAFKILGANNSVISPEEESILVQEEQDPSQEAVTNRCRGSSTEEANNHRSCISCDTRCSPDVIGE